VKKKLLVFGAILALAAGSVGVASAITPRSNPHYACISGGEIILITGNPDKCPPETVKALQISGYSGVGSPGPAGPPGPKGAPGPAGPPGAVNIQRVNNEAVADVAPWGQVRVTASCPAGTQAIGGSGRAIYDYDGATDGPVNLVLQSSFASSNDAWRAVWTNPSQWQVGTLRFQVTAVCA
jgi:hypothetical protein